MQIDLSKQNELRLIKSHVLALYLFGSRATGSAGPTSDFDFAIILEDPDILRDVSKKQIRYLELYDILTDIIGPQKTETIVDIVFLQSDVSLELKGHIIKKGVLLLDRDPNIRANLEATIMERAADFAPLLQEMDETILNRI